MGSRVGSAEWAALQYGPIKGATIKFKGWTHPLSRPFCPSFFPMSPTITPGMGRRVFGSRICTDHKKKKEKKKTDSSSEGHMEKQMKRSKTPTLRPSHRVPACSCRGLN